MGSASAGTDQGVATSDSGSIADYTDDDGVVDTSGLRDAIDDWRNGDADTDLLRDVIDAWRSGEPVVTVENVDLDTTHVTLQDAIDEAEVGNTLELGATTFAEDVTVDVDGLTLRGTDAGESTIDPAEIGITVEADEVTLEGLTFALDDEEADEVDGVHVTTGATAVTIVDNTFQQEQADFSTRVRGIYLEGADATVESNAFEGDGSANTPGIRLRTASEATIAANEFTETSTGVWASGNDARVEDNTFTDVSSWSIRTISGTQEIVNNSIDGGSSGIWLSGGDVVTITENEFETTSSGIRYNGHSVDATITNNVFTGANFGFYVSDFPDQHVGGIELHWNTIAGNGEGVNATHGEGTLDATDNWWGDGSGPSGEGPGDGDSVTENVVYDPWLGAQPGQTITGAVGATDFDQGQESVTQTLGAVDGGEPIEIDFGPHDVSTAVVRVDLSELPATIDDEYRFILDGASVDIDDDDITNAEVHYVPVIAGSDEAAIWLDVEDRFVTIEEFSLTGLDTQSVVTSDEFSYDVTLTDVTLADGTDVTDVRETTETQSFEIVPPEQTLSVDGAFDVSELATGDETATQYFGDAEDLTIDLNRDDVSTVQVNVDLTPLVDRDVDLDGADLENVDVGTNSVANVPTGVWPDRERASVRIADLDGDRTVELSSFEMVDVDLSDAESGDGLAYEIELDQLFIELPGGGAQHQPGAYNFEEIVTDEFDIESSSS
ncbi:right-handed parallel beta-helix repeat-containing protein [Natronobeatus ordinarius]|uniref:right-handed parallel beta-helix repeat-containing protein n=1 Tax=Natronobeatus ordinarius TaxID=2963433 RepID=UPI0020CD2CB6|nr:right-handed parallel beta-helix repeat-containing protein [Natronobeatus ordinarius]